MRVVHLTTSGELGGAETSLLAMIGALRRGEPRWALSVVAPAEGRLADRLRTLGVAVTVVPFPESLARFGESAESQAVRGWPRRAVMAGRAAPAALLYAWRLRSALRERHAELVHAHGFKMHILATLARPRGCALVWHVHGYLSGRPWTARAMRLLVRRASIVIANSRSVAADAERVLGPRALVKTVYNAVDLEAFSCEGTHVDLDRLAGLPPAPAGTVRIGLVGTYGRWKGHLVFLEALSKLPAVAPVRAYVIGAPIYATEGSQVTTEELRAHAVRLGLADRVGFTGFVSDVPGAMRSLDVVVHASTEPEPFGMVIAEAMACGRAVVASRGGGAVELFDEGVDALGHEPGDAPGLAAALTRLASDPVLRARLAANARARAERCFDRRQLVEAIVPLYRTLVR